MMLNTIIAGIVLLGVLFAAMAVGAILAGKPLRGSCGGVAGCDGCSQSGACKKRRRSGPGQG